MRRFLVSTIAMIWFILLQPSASACQCAGIASLEEELERSDVIFSGQAIAVESSVPGKATFKVTQVWRGTVSPLISTSNLWDCMSVFRIGEEYLVFARSKAERDPRSGYDLIASRCGQTRRLGDAQKTLIVLGPSFPPPETLINGPQGSTGLLVWIVGGFTLLFIVVGGIVIRRRMLRIRG